MLRQRGGGVRCEDARGRHYGWLASARTGLPVAGDILLPGLAVGVDVHDVTTAYERVVAEAAEERLYRGHTMYRRGRGRARHLTLPNNYTVYVKHIPPNADVCP